MRRRTLGFGTVLALLVALITHLAWPYWSPYPATLDGFVYVEYAEITITNAAFPAGQMAGDTFGYTGLIVAGSLLTGETPLTLVQPLTGIAGAGTALVAAALTCRFGRELGWSARQSQIATLFAVLGVAIGGIYLRRTSVADEEAIGLLLVPLVTLAAARAIRTRRRAWVLVAGGFLVVLPTVHNFSATVAVVALTALVVLLVARRPTRTNGLLAVGTIVGSWTYLYAYSDLVLRLGLGLPYTDRLREHPGLFIAWLFALLVGIVWFRRARTASQRAVILLPLATWLGLVVVNSLTTVFPGTVPTPRVVSLLVLGYVPTILLVGYAIPLCDIDHDAPTGSVILSLLGTAVVLTLYPLTTTLTPDFFGQAVRSQTFAHLPALIVAGLGVAKLLTGSTERHSSCVVRLVSDRGIARIVLVVLFLSGLLVTMPLAYVTLDTGEFPGTTTDSEYEAATFASTRLQTGFATDDPMARISTGNAGPARAWLVDGAEPQCPTLTRASWTTTGAHFFPAAPETLPPPAHERWLATGNVVYATTGPNPQYLRLPVDQPLAGC